MKTILVTGASGFLGRYIVREFSREWRVVAVSRSLAGSQTSMENVQDVSLEEAEIEEVVASHKPAGVIHAAVSYSPDSNPAGCLEANVELPLRVAKAILDHGGRFFVTIDSFFSKFPEYKHMVAYRLSKRYAVELLSLFAPQLVVVNAVMEHVIGSGDRPGKAIPGLIKRIVQGESAIDLTLGEQHRDFIHARDAASALAAIADWAVRQSSLQEVLNVDVGTGSSTSLRELLSRVKSLTGSRTELRFGAIPYRAGEPMASVANAAWLCDRGWSPRFNLEQTLEEMIEEAKS